jgi:hypothetical protein
MNTDSERYFSSPMKLELGRETHAETRRTRRRKRTCIRIPRSSLCLRVFVVFLRTWLSVFHPCSSVALAISPHFDIPPILTPQDHRKINIAFDMLRGVCYHPALFT